VFLCPSQAPVAQLEWNGVVLCFAHLNYAANNGLGPMAESDVNDLPTTRPTGVFSLNSWTRAADVRDGLSNTVFVSEIRAVAESDMRGIHYPEGILYQYNYTPNSPMPDEIRAGYCVSAPDAPCEGNLFSSWIPRCLTQTTRSSHPGGVNVLLGDGGVRFVGNSIALTVWQALGTPNGGEVIGDF
jgi:prepilin-type processing-associated H-X9-DG protein